LRTYPSEKRIADAFQRIPKTAARGFRARLASCTCWASAYPVTDNKHDADDLMGEAFVEVWERWDLVQAFQNRDATCTGRR
jgi:hypothetical protein